MTKQHSDEETALILEADLDRYGILAELREQAEVAKRQAILEALDASERVKNQLAELNIRLTEGANTEAYNKYALILEGFEAFLEVFRKGIEPI